MHRNIRAFLIGLLLTPLPLLAGYQASPSSTTVGTDSSSASSSILRLRVTSIGATSSYVTFRLEKIDGTAFSRGKASLRLGCGTGCTLVQEFVDTTDGKAFYEFTVNMPSYVTGTSTGQFYGRFDSTNPATFGYWTWVGPSAISAPALPTPGSLSATSITTSSARLNWGVSTGADNYRYQVTTDATFSTSGDGSTCSNCISGGNSTTTSLLANLSGLQASQTYRWRVRAGNTATGQGSLWTSTQSFVTAAPSPTISNVTVTPASVHAGTTQTVNWSSSNQSWYFFQLYNSNGTAAVSTAAFLSADCIAAGSSGSDGCLGQTNPSSARSDSWTLPSPSALPPGQYRIKVAVWSSPTLNAGALSPAFTVTSPPAPPLGNVNLNPSVLGEGQTLNLSWTASNQHHYTYLLYEADTDQPIDTSAFLPSSCPTGSGPQGCIGFSYSSTDRSAAWLVPANAPHQRARVKVAIWDPYGTPSACCDYSPVFTIGPTVENVAVSPSSSRPGQAQTISWTSTKQSWYMVMLYNSNHSAAVNTSAFGFPSCVPLGPSASLGGCIEQTNPSAAQSTSWTLPAALQPGQYTIKVAVWNNSTDSEGNYSSTFTVNSPLAQVQQLSVNPTQLRGGQAQTVSWSSQFQNYYEATLLTDSGTVVDTSAFLANGCPASSGSTGCLGKGTTAASLSWTPPVGFPAGAYKVKLAVRYSAGDSPTLATSSIFDISGSYLNVSDWAQEAASYLVTHGIVVSPPNGDLGGASAMNRAELATLLYRSLGGGLSSADDFFETAYGELPDSVFSDVADPDVWYHRPATYLGLLSYVDDPNRITVFDRQSGTFRPAQTISRAWTSKALLEAINQPPLASLAGVTLYNDVPESHPVAAYVYKARQLGLVSFDPASPYFRPDEPANREDLFVMLHRCLEGTANILGTTVGIDSPTTVDFDRDRAAVEIGHRYEQPIIFGADAPAFDLNVFGPRLENLGILTNVYTVDLTATITALDTRTFLDAAGRAHTANPFCAWEASGGSFIDQTPAGTPAFCRVKWVAPIDFSPYAGASADFEITVYVGDGLGTELRAVRTLSINQPSADPTQPTVSLDPLPSSILGGERLSIAGSVTDSGASSAVDFGILQVVVFASWDSGWSWARLGRARLTGNGDFALSYLVPRSPGTLSLRAVATNLRGNLQTSAVRSLAVQPRLSIEGMVAESSGAAIVNVPVRLTGGVLDLTRRTDHLGGYAFDSSDGLTAGSVYRVEATWGIRSQAIAGIVLSASIPSFYNVLRFDTVPPSTTVSLPEGRYRDPIQVELQCLDRDTDCAATYFTIDGSTPTSSSQPYSGPISFNSDVELRFFSIDVEGNAELPVQATYTFDSCQPPVAGDWVVAASCRLSGSAVAPANVIVEPGAVLTIESGALLEIDLHHFKLLVRQGGGVLVRQGGTVRQTSTP